MQCSRDSAGCLWKASRNPYSSQPETVSFCRVGRPFSLSTNLSLTPVDYRVLLEALKNGDAAAPRESSEHYVVGGHFALSGGHADILLNSLPPIVHIRKESDKAAMRWSLERMREEVRNPQPGGSLITQQLAYMMLVKLSGCTSRMGRKLCRLALCIGK